MTDRVRPSIQAPGKHHEVATTIAAGGGTDGWIVPAGETSLADEDADLDDTVLNEFAHVATNGRDVTFDPGEAFVGGAWVARDTQTTVTLAESTANQTVYLGWDKSARDSVVIGLDAAFAADDRRLALYEFDTDATSVTASTDVRPVGEDAGRFSTEDAQDATADLLSGGTNIDLTEDDGNDQLKIDGKSDESIQDLVAALLAAGNAITLSYDDAGDSLTVSVDSNSIGDDELSFDFGPRARSAIESGDVDYVKFANIEDVSAGQLGRDDSIGFLGRWGGNGTAPLWDAYNVQAGSGVSVSGGTGAEDNPQLSVNESQVNHDNLAGGTDPNAHRHMEAKSTNGGTSSSVTWTTSFASTPVVVPGMGYDTFDVGVSSKSTTGAEIQTGYSADTHEVIAMEQT